MSMSLAKFLNIQSVNLQELAEELIISGILGNFAYILSISVKERETSWIVLKLVSS
jgi:hypothetical protein